MTISTRSTFKYMLLPEILPRVRDFTTSGFYYIALFITLAFARAGLLPNNHPYLNPDNAGRFSIRQVLAEGRRHLVFRREDSDRVIIYYAVVGGLFLLFAQAVFLVMTLAVHHAEAASWASWHSLVTPYPENDVAFRLLDYVFGYPGIYNSCVNTNIPCPDINGLPSPFHPNSVDISNSVSHAPWPNAFHAGLHTLFTFYNLGVAIVGFVIFLYLVVSVIGNTAATGKPFGKEFNYWAPIRLIIAAGLLAPYGNGLNGAQVSTLYVAKWGSSLATNGWIIFNQKLTAGGSTLTGMPENLVFKPSQPPADAILEFMLVAKTCQYAQKMMNNTDITAYQVANTGSGAQAMQTDTSNGFTKALAFSNNHDIILRFGVMSSTLYPNERGNVSPLCGEIIIPVLDVSSPQGGAMTVQNAYYNLLVARWNDPDNATMAQEIASKTLPTYGHNPEAITIDTTTIKSVRDAMAAKIATAINDGWTAQQQDPRWIQDMTTLGWGGAAIWVNRIAEYNGSYISAVSHVPAPSHYPLIMEQTAQQRQEHDNDTNGEARFQPSLDDNTLVYFPNRGDINISVALYAAEMVWEKQVVPSRGSPIEDVLTGIFGLHGLFDLLGNKDVHPLAQLVGIGRSLIENAESSLTISVGVGVMGQLAQMLSNSTIKVGNLATGAGSIMLNISMVCFMVGMFLYYGVPFIPFIYFFFAMGSWVKAIFEAMIGLPLWALSFVRTDAEGLVSSASLNGFYLLLEIFLRPILIVFGFIAAIAFFSAQAYVLSQIWDFLIANIGGADPASSNTDMIQHARSVVDGFFYTILYTIIIYMLALSSFKLVDLFPKSILRWMGSQARPFHTQEDPGAQFMKNIGKIQTQVQSGFGGGITAMLFGRNQQ